MGLSMESVTPCCLWVVLQILSVGTVCMWKIPLTQDQVNPKQLGPGEAPRALAISLYSDNGVQHDSIEAGPGDPGRLQL